MRLQARGTTGGCPGLDAPLQSYGIWCFLGAPSPPASPGAHRADFSPSTFTLPPLPDHLPPSGILVHPPEPRTRLSPGGKGRGSAARLLLWGSWARRRGWITALGPPRVGSLRSREVECGHQCGAEGTREGSSVLLGSGRSWLGPCLRGAV